MIQARTAEPCVTDLSRMGSLMSFRTSSVRRTLVGVAVFFFLQPVSASAQAPDLVLQAALDSLSDTRMLTDIQTLSDPSFNGRQTGTEGDLFSAQWIAEEFRRAGLRQPHITAGPLQSSSFGRKHGNVLGAMSTLIMAPVITPDPILKIGTAAALTTKHIGTDYFPIFDSPSANIQAPVVFVGYGIVDQAQHLDDYAGVEVNNCIVLFLRGKPGHYTRPVSHADKVRWARERGAIGYLTATGPVLNPYEVRRGVAGNPNAFYGQLPPDQAIPGAWVSTAVAEALLAGLNNETSEHLRTLQEQLNTAPSPHATQTDRYAVLQWKTTLEQGILANVIGMIPGTGPETVIIGAHRDHFGRPGGVLFPGADDNASGTAVILEVARSLAKIDQRPTRTLLFMSFSGEERDMLGSSFYTSEPLVPLNVTKAMINIDHAGVGNGRLTVGVTGIEKDVALEAGQSAGVKEKLDLYGFFPGGDHVPFKEAGVPTVTVVSGGVHPHFHQPSDTADTIDPKILKTAAQFVLALTWQLAYMPEVEVKP